MNVGALPPASNRAQWDFVVSIEDADTDEAVTIDGASIQFDVRSRDTLSTMLTASTDNGKISIVDTGSFKITFTPSDMSQLCAETYDVGCIITINGVTRQLIIGVLPVLDGIVSN